MVPIKIMAEVWDKGVVPEYLFWVGCAGSFDSRAQRITKSFALILQKAEVEFAVLGKEENCTGDPARRAGNEFLFQMMAYQNIQLLNQYKVKKIVTTCPHCFNTLKNEYPELGGEYEVIHHTQLLQELIDTGRIVLKEGGPYHGKKVTFHDSCYLGRSNGVYEAPRKLLELLETELTEMKRCRSNGLCCGAGGAQMFKEEENGLTRINKERAMDAAETKAVLVATACPFCQTMLSDGLKSESSNQIEVKDISELIAMSLID